MALVNQFQTKFDNAVTLYGTVANDIRKLARSGNISSQLNEFSNVLATLRNRNPQMLQEIKSVVLNFQQLELEARRYVELAKSFAEENIYVAQNVLNGVRYYDPESILQNFKETAEGLDKAFKAVLDKHGEIEWDISSIRSQATGAGQRARVLASKANTNMLCRTPVLGVVLAPAVRTAESGLVGLVKGIVESVGSTVLLGVPAIAAAEERDKLKQLERMYSSIAAFMENFMQLVKGHKDLLTTISARVGVLPGEYELLEKTYKERTLKLYKIDLFKEKCVGIVRACDEYLM